MRSFFTIILQFVAVMDMVLLAATLGGFMVWLLWPLVIPSVFPGLVASGAVTGEIGLLSSILLHWMASILFSSLVMKSPKSSEK